MADYGHKRIGTVTRGATRFSVCECGMEREEGTGWPNTRCQFPTPVPAASERMTAEELDQVRTILAAPALIGPGIHPEIVRRLIAHVGEQAAQIAAMKRNSRAVGVELFAEIERLRDGLQTAVLGLRCALAIFDGSNKIGPRINVVRDAFKVAAQAYDHKGTVALSPQPDRAKASPDVEEISHKLGQWGEAYPVEQFPEPDKDEVAWLHRTKPGLCDQISGSMGRHAFKVWGWPALLMIRTLTARADAAEARAETARAEALEEAAKVCERLDLRPDPNGRIDSDGYMIEQIDSENSRPDLAKSIRALLTAPPPTTKESET